MDIHTVQALMPQVRYIHYSVVDLGGILRVRVLPIAQCLKMEARKEPKRVASGSLLGRADVAIGSMPGKYHQGCDYWYPEWTSLKMMDKENASVICRVGKLIAVDSNGGLQGSFGRCPRTALQRTVAAAFEQTHCPISIGLELEFYLIEVGTTGTPSENSLQLLPCNYWSQASLLRGKPARCLSACVKALQYAGIELEQFHGEFSPQQFEISLKPQSPLDAIDGANQAMEIIRRTADERGMRAIFHPKPFSTYDSCGLHVHLSIGAKDNQPSSELCQKFLGGIMQRLTILCALGMPIKEGWQARVSTLGGWAAWGTENRHVPVRAISENHWEFRAVDVFANLYLVVAAYIAAGMLGIRDNIELSIADCLKDPEKLTLAARSELGITTPLPDTGDEPYAELERDCQDLDTILGKEVLTHYHATREARCKLDQRAWNDYLLATY